jgi:aminotransferase
VAPASLVNHMIPIQEVSLCCPSVIAQHAALYAIDHPELITQTHQKLAQLRQEVCKTLDTLTQTGLITYAPPQAGFYVFAKTSYADSTPFVLDLLNKAKVAVVPGNDFGKDFGSYFRLCFAREMNIVQEGMARLQRYITDLPTQPLMQSGQQQQL